MLNSLGDIAKAKFHNAPIRIRAIVSGKSATPYKIPLEIEVKCLGCDDAHCRYANGKKLTVEPKDETFLQFIDVHSNRLKSIVKGIFQIGCENFAVKVMATQNVLRVFIAQPPGEDRTKWISSQTSYYVGHDIDANHTYYLNGYSTVDPRTQVTTYVFTNVEKAKSDIESFELTSKSKKRLDAFNEHGCKTVEDVFAYLNELYESYSLNVTKIYDRFLLHLAVDIVFHSALEFKLPKGKVVPARMDAIVLGDTRCGKGHVAEGLSKYYGIGEVVGAENCFSGDTEIITSRGVVKIKDADNEEFLLNRYANWIKSEIKEFGKQKTVEVKFRHKSSRRAKIVRTTLDHNWRLLNGKKIKTSELRVGDEIKFVRHQRRINKNQWQDYNNGIIHGLIFGDGHGSKRGYSIRLCRDSKDLLPYFDRYEKKVQYYQTYGGDPVVKLKKDYIEWKFKSNQNLKELPTGEESENYLVGFFRGWFAADGNGGKQPGIAGDRKYLQWAMKIMPRFGYYFYTLNTARKRTNFGLRKRDTCSVHISPLSLTKEDFLIKRQAKKFKELKSNFSFRGIIKGSERKEKVYCAKVPTTHDFVLADGLLTCNCSFAGLVGGAQQIGNHWMISWGRIPLNDRGLVIIDEASELKDSDWTRMSRIRSEGVAEVTKIQQQLTNARCRLLFLANPPSKAMSNYTFGVHALKDLVHAPEDIARFDFACVVSHEEVSVENINKQYDTTDFLFSSALERELIMWIWSRTSDQIHFTPEAVEEIFNVSNRSGKFYDIGIPLIQGENVRFKIAKMAIAFAGRLYSSSEHGSTLLVKRLHVKCAASFVRMLYKSDVNGYYDHSWQRKQLNPELQQKNIDALVAYFNAYKSQDEAYQYLLNNTYITARDLTEHLNVSIQTATEIVSRLIQYKCIIKKDTTASGGTYLKTPHFTKWLRNKVRAARRARA